MKCKPACILLWFGVLFDILTMIFAIINILNNTILGIGANDIARFGDSEPVGITGTMGVLLYFSVGLIGIAVLHALIQAITCAILKSSKTSPTAIKVFGIFGLISSCIATGFSLITVITGIMTAETPLTFVSFFAYIFLGILPAILLLRPQHKNLHKDEIIKENCEG